MAVDYNRQYVGARYVPTFFKNPDGTWDWAPGFQYEPLTMVKYGENTYTSRQLVPSNIGTPNLNPEYWANTGNFNGSIINLQKQINDLASQISPYFSHKFYGSKICFIGDSITIGTTANVNFPSLIQEWTGAVVDNKGVNGATITEVPGRTSYKNIVDSLSGTYDYIVVMLGTNDIDLNININDVSSSYFETTLSLVNKFPSAKLIICTPIFQQGKQNEGQQIATIIKNSVSPFNSVIVDTLNTCGINFFNTSTYLNDNLHPNDSGQVAIARCILDACTSSPPILTKYSMVNIGISSAIDVLDLSDNSYAVYEPGKLFLYISGTASSNINAGKLINLNIAPVSRGAIEFCTQHGTMAIGNGYISCYQNIQAGKIDVSVVVPMVTMN